MAAYSGSISVVDLVAKQHPVDAPAHCRGTLTYRMTPWLVAAAMVGAATGLFFEPPADNEPHLLAMPKIIWRQAVTSGTAEGCTSCQRPMQR